MRKQLMAAALVVLVPAPPAMAQLDSLIEVCGSASADPRDVISFCQRALDTGKLDRRAEAQVRANMGVGYYETGQFQSAVDAYSKAIAAEPALVAAYLNRARALDKLGRLPDAAADYEAVLRIDPRAAEAYLGRGAMLLSHGDPRRAVTDLSAVIELQPDWISPWFNRGVAYLRLTMFAQAERDFSVVITRNPEDSGAYLNRGRARAALKLSTAAGDFDRAVALEPEWGGAWFARGRYRDGLGDREAANGDFIRAYELGYADPWLVERLREISG